MELNKYIDHTKLGAYCTEESIKQLCKEAKEYKFKSVCINPCFIPLAKAELEGSDVLVCTVIGFPHGATTTETKVFETKDAIKKGADEIDMVINVSDLKNGHKDRVLKEIKKIKEYERINLEFIDNIPLELILYKYDKDDIHFIIGYFGYYDKKKIDIINLPISSFNDISITSTEIISIIDKSPGPWIKDVTKKLEEAILLNKINNTEKNIVDFLEKIRDNI